MPHKLIIALVASTVLIAAGGKAFGQDAPENLNIKPTAGVLLPSPSVTETRDATALSVNPSNIALLDSWNFVYAGSWLKDQEHLAGQGHGFFFAFPLGPLALGFATEMLTPPSEIQEWQRLDDRVRFSFGAALHFRRAVSLGFAYRTFWAYSVGEIDTFDLGLTVHPVNYLALSFVASDINAPEYRYDSDVRAPRKFNVGLTIRPFGNDRLSVGGELNYLYGDDYRRTDTTALLTAMIVDGITLRGRFGAEGLRDDDYETGYFLDGSIALDLPNFGVGVGMFGQVHPDDKSEYQGTVWTARFSGDEAPSITLPRPIRAAHAAVIDLEEELNTYSFVSLLQLFERIERDDGVDMVVLRPDPGTISMVQAQEIRRQIIKLRESGRSVVCYMAAATGPVYLACSAADHVWINPGGGINYSGIAVTQLYFGELFEKLGVNADFIRIGEYKSAPEMFTRTEPSNPAAEQMNRYLDSIYDDILTDLTEDRNLGSLDSVKALIEQGPFTAKEALAAGLVDKLVPADLLEDEIRGAAGSPIFIDDRYGTSPLRHRRYIDAPAVAVVHIDGDIVDGESVDIPFFNIKMTGAKTITEILRKLRMDRQIQAVLLRIDSPGGSALGSEIIWREIMALRREKPVIASMGSVAASGGYYIASAADEIFAETSTLTGSIGIFSGKVDLSRLLDKIGIDTATFKRGTHADAQSWTRPYTPEERKQIMHQINEFYTMFKDRVVEGRGRGFDREIVDSLGRGRIWSGSDAHHHLLVDTIGGYSDALNRARELGRVPDDIQVFQYPGPSGGFFKRMMRSFTEMVREPSAFEKIISVSGLKPTLREVIPFATVDSQAPRARLPFVLIEE